MESADFYRPLSNVMDIPTFFAKRMSNFPHELPAINYN